MSTGREREEKGQGCEEISNVLLHGKRNAQMERDEEEDARFEEGVEIAEAERAAHC